MINSTSNRPLRFQSCGDTKNPSRPFMESPSLVKPNPFQQSSPPPSPLLAPHTQCYHQPVCLNRLLTRHYSVGPDPRMFHRANLGGQSTGLDRGIDDKAADATTHCQLEEEFVAEPFGAISVRPGISVMPGQSCYISHTERHSHLPPCCVDRAMPDKYFIHHNRR